MDNQSYYENLIKVVIDASVADTWELAVLEWEIYDCEEDENLSSRCVCKHEGLRYLYTIRNVKNGNKLFPIGSTCIKKFEREDLNEEISSEPVFKFRPLIINHFKLIFKELVSFMQLFLTLLNNITIIISYFNLNREEYKFNCIIFIKFYTNE